MTNLYNENPFNNSKWIGKKYQIIKHKRNKHKTIMHFPLSSMRRGVDKFYDLLGYENRDFLKAPYFRKKIYLEQVKNAEINMTGLGYFELYINGVKVGDDILSPPFSQYEKTVYYEKYDVTQYLKEGENVISVILGNGMYNVHLNNAWNYDTSHWRGVPKFILSGYFEGKENVSLVSDETWKVSDGAIISNDIYGGEYYDARLEKNGWNQVGFDDSNWEKVVTFESPTEKLKLLNMEPTKVIKEIKPVNYWRVGEKKWVFDLGVNIAGFVRLSAKASKGQEVIISYAEKVTDNLLDRESILEHTDKKYHKYIQRDKYIFNSNQVESWQPRFTYHAFQYVEIDGLEEVDESTITGLLVHTAVEEFGSFSCSNELLNKIFKAMNQSNTNNYQGIPTDCPHREKNGWTGDVNLSIEYQLLTYSSEHLLKKWLLDIKDGQLKSGQIAAIAPTPGWGYNWISGPVWDSSFIIIPWNIYLYRGDVEFLETLYEPMKNYLKWQDKKTKNNLIKYGLGDWCSPNMPANKPKVPVPLTSTAYHYETFRLMAKIAKVLDKSEDEKFYNKRVTAIYKAFNKAFVNQETGYIKGDCQSSYAGVLYFNLVDDKVKPLVVNKLIEQVEKYNYHVDTGIIGTRFLFDALSDHGYIDAAYKIATQTDFPSWGYWINQGATTLWENWDGKQSRNHRMFGSINSWFYLYLAGIQVDEENPGFEKIVIKPHFVDDLDWVKADTYTKYGKVFVEWKRLDEKIELKIDTPKECNVTVYIDNKHKEIVNNLHNHTVNYY